MNTKEKTYKYDLTIIVPSIRQDKISELIDSIPDSIAEFAAQIIIVGPHGLSDDLSNYSNISNIIDYGSPSRGLQKAAYLAEGRLLTWASDDGLYVPNALSKCIKLLYDHDEKDGLIVKYHESPGRVGQDPESIMWKDEYWISWTHEALRLAGIPQDYWTAR